MISKHVWRLGIVVLVIALLYRCEKNAEHARRGFEMGLNLLGDRAIIIPENFKSILLCVGETKRHFTKLEEIENLRQFLYAHRIEAEHQIFQGVGNDGREELVGTIAIQIQNSDYIVKIERSMTQKELFALEFYSVGSFGGSSQYLRLTDFDMQQFINLGQGQ